ncbi:trihelix transcription factor ASR3-like [Typha angustifolia]|uniref:trihelix transcription factor ASR3-like n=1 Tax=Typha angustifolia TaxID=59011 RepID=UPI003C2CC795
MLYFMHTKSDNSLIVVNDQILGIHLWTWIAYQFKLLFLNIFINPPPYLLSRFVSRPSVTSPSTKSYARDIPKMENAVNSAVTATATRAHRLPRWTGHEILVLLRAKRAVERHRRRQSPAAEPKWAAVSDYCRRGGVDRGPLQCRKRWGNLVCDFKKIRSWEMGEKGGESFWGMRSDRRRARRLPGCFDRQVYEMIKRGEEESEEEEEEEEEIEMEREEEEVVFDSGRKESGEGLFEDEEEAMMVLPISERKYEPFQEEFSDPDMMNDKQQADISEKGSSRQEGPKLKRSSSPEIAEETSLENKLIEVLQKNSTMLTAQLETQNHNYQLDRDQRKEQADHLLNVLSKLADAVERIADKL